jgi:hypothetical protein
MTTDISDFLADERRKVSIQFRVDGGRLFTRNAELTNLDPLSIELRCTAIDRHFDDDVIFGTDSHPVHSPFEALDSDGDESKPVKQEVGWSLHSIPTTIMVVQVDEAKISKSAEENDGEPIFGKFWFHAPVQTSDGVVNEKWATAHAWVGVGPETFRLVRDQLLRFEQDDFAIGLGIMFPEGTVDRNWVGSVVKWDGKGILPVTGVGIVWQRGHWSSDKLLPPPVTQQSERLNDQPSREHIELLDASRRIEAAVSRLLAPLWLAAAALLVFIAFRH